MVYGFSDGTYHALPSPFENTPDSVSATASAGIIHSGSAFLAVPEASVAGVNNLKIEESHKTSEAPAVDFFRVAEPLSAPGRLYINLSEGTGAAKQLLDGVLALWEQGGNGPGEEVTKAINGGENLSLRAGEEDFIIRSFTRLRNGVTLPLRLWNTTAKTYLLETKAVNLEQSGLSGYLVDRYRQTKTPFSLREGAITPLPVTLTADAASRDPERFYLLFEPPLIPLPLQVSSLRAYQKGSGAVVEWRVEDDRGIREYVVEKSSGSPGFTPLKALAATGAAGPQVYQVPDPQPGAANFYRIRLNEVGGGVRYSAVVKLALHPNPETILLSSNPVTGGVLNLFFQNKKAGVYELAVFNAAGQKVLQKKLVHPGGSCVRSIGLNHNLAEGIYTLELKSSDVWHERVNFLLKKR